MMPLLEIKNLKIEFGRGLDALRAVDGVSLTLEAGETLCVVGESGSGKTVTALSIARLVPSPPARYAGGEILLQGRDVLKMSAAELRGIRGRVVSYVFQEPGASLNPVFRVGHQIKESLQLHRHVTIQADIIDLLRELKQRLGMAIVLITHNLGIVADLADRVAVMYAGQIVETAPARALLKQPLHPYTQALMLSVPGLGARSERLPAIPGSVPQLGAFPSGCRFHPRCARVRPDCSLEVPDLLEVEPGRWVRCPYWGYEPRISGSESEVST